MKDHPILEIHLLGDFRLVYGNEVIRQGQVTRAEMLLVYLLLHRASSVPRQRLAFLFWPDTSEYQARSNFRKAVYRLRQNLPMLEQYLDMDGAEIHWQRGEYLRLDVALFENELELAGETNNQDEKIARLQAALDLYRGDLLPDLYEDWVSPLREQLRQRYITALENLAECLEQKSEYVAAGDVVRRSLQEDALREESYRRLMRLQALSGDVAGALRAYHACVTQLEQELGIKPSPATQETYQLLLNRRALPEDTVVSPSPRQLPLIGRNEVWQTLLNVWRAASAGESQAVIISGEAGIGKTRLAEELLNWTARQGIVTLKAHCFAQLEELPFGPITEWLRSDQAQKALPNLAPRWRSELARVLPELLAADPSLEPPRQMTEAWQRQHLFMALVEAALAAGDPLLLFLDDLHWADANTLDWIHFLMRRTIKNRLLLLITFRSEQVTPNHPIVTWQQELARAVHVNHIALDRLDSVSTMTLAAHLLGRELDEDADRLYQATEGNPLFIVEITRAGLQNNGLPLPEKVRSVIDIRLNQLSLQANELAGLAAVIGRSFTFSLLTRVSQQSEEQIVNCLDELWQRRVIRERGADAYDFSHDKIREVAIAKIGSARRLFWHRKIAEALIQQNTPDLDAVHGEIASHWEAANEPRQAAHHFQQAARAASRLYAHQDAVDYLERALPLVPGDDRQMRVDVHVQLGEAFTALGNHERAIILFRQAATATVDSLERERYLCECIKALNGCARSDEGRAVYDEAMSLLEGVPASERESNWWSAWINLQLVWLDTLYLLDDSNAMQLVGRRMMEPVEAHGTPRQHAEYLAFQVRTRYRQERFRPAFDYTAQIQTSLDWARKTDDINFIRYFEFSLGFSFLWSGKTTEAIAQLQTTLAQAEELGHVPLQNRCYTYLSIAHRFRGDIDDVRRLIEQGALIAETEGYPNYLGVADANRAWLDWRAGDRIELERLGHSALAHWKSSAVGGNIYPFEWLARFPMLALAIAENRVDDARDHAAAMLDPSQQRLPDSMTAALESALQEESKQASLLYLQEACRLAQEQGYL